jgi:hypothetical protein
VANAILPGNACTFAIYSRPLEALTHAEHGRASAGVLLPAARDDIPDLIGRLQKTALLARRTPRPRPLQYVEKYLPYGFSFERSGP